MQTNKSERMRCPQKLKLTPLQWQTQYHDGGVYVEVTVLERWSSFKLALFNGWCNKLCCHVAGSEVGTIPMYFLFCIKEIATCANLSCFW